MKKIEILYEDKDYLVINKPAGIMVHGDGRSKEKTLVDWILDKYPEIEKVGEPIITTEGEVLRRPGIVHRLDKDTSGVLAIAKTMEAYSHLKNQFQKHKVKKVYHAFVKGEFGKDKLGRIEKPIGRSKNDFRQWSSSRGAKGETREAETLYEVLNQGKGYSFVEVRPMTGRTHQIRVHFKSINHPVVNDTLYGTGETGELGLKRLALHSSKIKFKNLKGEIIYVEAKLPKEFKKAVQMIDAN